MSVHWSPKLVQEYKARMKKAHRSIEATTYPNGGLLPILSKHERKRDA